MLDELYHTGQNLGESICNVENTIDLCIGTIETIQSTYLHAPKLFVLMHFHFSNDAIPVRQHEISEILSQHKSLHTTQTW